MSEPLRASNVDRVGRIRVGVRFPDERSPPDTPLQEDEICDAAITTFLNARFTQAPFDRYAPLDPDWSFVSIDLNSSHVPALEALAHRDGVYVEDVVRTALILYLDAETEGDP